MVDHMDRIWDGLNEYKEIIEGLNYTNDSIATNLTNKTIRLLTIITTLMLPLTVVSSFFGMNLRLPFMDSELGVLYIFLIIFAFIGIVVLLLRKLRVI
jgi:magnesium transporter